MEDYVENQVFLERVSIFLFFCEKRNRSCAPRHIRRYVSKVRGANKRVHPLYLTRQRPQRRETNREERRR